MSLTGSCFSPESAPRPWDSKTRRSNLTGGLTVKLWQVQAEVRTHLIHRPARDIISPLGGAREAILLNSMFDLPSLEGVREVMISQQVVEGTAGPLYTYAGGARAI